MPVGELVVVDAVEVPWGTLEVVDSTAVGTAAAGAVGTAVAGDVGNAAGVAVADIAPAELVPAVAAPLDPCDAHAHSTHHLGHVAARKGPLRKFDGPWAHSLEPLVEGPPEPRLQLQQHGDRAGE